MKKYIKSVLIVMVLLLLPTLSACTRRQAASYQPTPELSAATPAPTPRPEPTPEPPRTVTVWGRDFKSNDETLDLSGAQGEISELCAAAAEFDDVLNISLGEGALSVEDYSSLRGAFPQTDIRCVMELYGVSYDTADDALILNDIAIDELDTLRTLLDAAPPLKKVEMCNCGLADSDMETLMERYPDVDFVWIIRFGYGKYVVRTDLVCFSSLRMSFDYEDLRYTEADMAPLFKYCKHLKALDLGHNLIQDISLIANLKELKVLVLSDNPKLQDLSPLGELESLEYLELFSLKQDVDYSFLYKLDKLKYLNLSYDTALHSIDYIENMPELEMFWFRGSGIAEDLAAEYEEKYPDVLFHYGDCHHYASSTCHGWRETETNLSIRTAFFNWKYVTAMDTLEDVSYQPDVKLTYAEPMN